ncbi:hypothetical protein MMC34_002315 [Xylographa carneopallida]|nr:hypothetical protein [Xylographa carneopallida]
MTASGRTGGHDRAWSVVAEFFFWTCLQIPALRFEDAENPSPVSRAALVGASHALFIHVPKQNPIHQDWKIGLGTDAREAFCSCSAHAVHFLLLPTPYRTENVTRAINTTTVWLGDTPEGPDTTSGGLNSLRTTDYQGVDKLFLQSPDDDPKLKESEIILSGAYATSAKDQINLDREIVHLISALPDQCSELRGLFSLAEANHRTHARDQRHWVCTAKADVTTSMVEVADGSWLPWERFLEALAVGAHVTNGEDQRQKEEKSTKR